MASKDKHEPHPPGVEMSKTQKMKEQKRRAKADFAVQHIDIIKDDFWNRRPWLLSEHLAKGTQDK